MDENANNIYKPRDQWSFKRSPDYWPGMKSNSFIHLMVSEKKTFEYFFFLKFIFFVTLASNQIHGFGQKPYET